MARWTCHAAVNFRKALLLIRSERMKEAPKTTAKQRQQAAQQLLEAGKKPYLVWNMPRTIL